MSECIWQSRVSALADGECPTDDMAAVHAHLTDCASCATLLHDVMVLGASGLGQPANAGNIAPITSITALPAARPKSMRRLLLPVAAIVAAAAVATIWWTQHRQAPTPQLAIAVQLAPQRTQEAMFSGAAFAAYRPYDANRGDVRHELIDLEVISALQQQGRSADLLAALAVSGDLARAKQIAMSATTQASDKAALALVAGDEDAALGYAHEALRRNPHDIAAQWNLGLAANRLGLWRVSRAAMGQVAASGVAGWSDEARQRAAAADSEAARFDHAFALFQQKGARWVSGEGSELNADDLARFPGYVRVYFYDAARVARSDADFQKLDKVAALLDQQLHNTVASQAAQRARSTVTGRTPWIAAYRNVAARTATDAQSNELWKSLANLGPAIDDLKIGTAVAVGKLSEVGATAQRLARWHDAWFDMLLVIDAAHHLAPGLAAQQMRDALKQCPMPGLEHRCATLAQNLAAILSANYQNDEAELHANHAVQWMEQGGMQPFLSAARAFRAEIWRQRGRVDRARAEFAEVALTPGNCETSRYAAIGQANLALVAGDWAAVRAALPAAKSDCVAPLHFLELTTAVDLARHSGDATDRTRAEAWIAAAQQDGDAEMQQVVTVARARLGGPRENQNLQAWLNRASAMPPFDQTLGIRTWAYTTLISNAGQASDWAMAMDVANRESGSTHVNPATCRLLVSLDDDLFTVSIEAAHSFAGGQKSLSPNALSGNLAKELPASVLSQAHACARIDVIARPPLHGRPDLLPAELTWQFISPGTPAKPTITNVGTTLLIADARPAFLSSDLPALTTMIDQRGLFGSALLGSEATPTRVLQALGTATYAEFHVHGIAAAHGDDAAQLALSPDVDGQYLLSARAVRTARLRGAPIVVLAACRASTSAPYLRERWSLPDAFLAAGARAVIAVDVAMPDRAATQFFAALRGKLEAGVDPAESLAQLRAAAPPSDRGWIDRVMVFTVAAP